MPATHSQPVPSRLECVIVKSKTSAIRNVAKTMISGAIKRMSPVLF